MGFGNANLTASFSLKFFSGAPSPTRRDKVQFLCLNNLFICLCLTHSEPLVGAYNSLALRAFTWTAPSCLEALAFCPRAVQIPTHSLKCQFRCLSLEDTISCSRFTTFLSLHHLEDNKNGPERSLLLTATSCFSHVHFLSLPLFFSYKFHEHLWT